MNETLWSSQEWLQEILQSFEEVAWSANPTTWEILFISRSAERVYGRPEADFFLNRDLWRSLIHPDDRDRVERLLPILFSANVLDLEYRIVRPSGAVRRLYHRLRLIRDVNGEALRIDGMATDITERQQDKEITQRTREAQGANLASQEFQTIFHGSLDAMLLADDEGKCIDANAAACELFGRTREELLGCDASNFAEPGFDFARAWHSFLEQGRVTGEFRLLRLDGTVRETECTAIANVLPHRHLSVLRDLTERKQAELAMQQQMERERLLGAIARRIRQSLNLDEILTTTVEEVRQLLQNDRVLLFHLCGDGVGRVVTESMAPGLPAIVELEFPDETFPQECYQHYCQGQPRVVPDITRDELAPCLTEFLQQLGVKSKLVIPILCHSQRGERANSCQLNDRTSLWGVMSAHDCSGTRQWQQWEIDLLCSLATQIGIALQQSELYLQLESQLIELQQTEAVLQQAKEAAEVANRAKSEFLANMSHELRTPLNGILGYAQILKQDTTLTAQQQDSLTIIHQCGEHLLTLIDDVLDLSKIEACKMELLTREFHLPNVLNSLADLFRMRAQQKDISFTYEILSPLPQGVIADEKRLRQVLINLLSNAIKFTDKGGVTFKVGYSSAIADSGSVEEKRQATADKIRFQVEDTGIGIEPDQLAAIFLPFHQASDFLKDSWTSSRFANASRARAVEGTGLGLAISQKLVQMMGSEIQVRSTVGEGSVFWFDLDLLPVSGWQEPNPSSDRRLIGVQGHKRKVLIVDDDSINRSVLRTLLEPLRFEILEAVDGRDCLNKALEFYPDLILMDLVMPEMDGLEATRRLRQLPQFQNVVAIALSAHAFETTKQESLAAGCQAFLSKPVQVKQLLELLTTHLELEGIYEENSSPTTPEPNSDSIPLIPPSLAELAALLTLVKIGDVQCILERVDRLESLDDRLVPFAAFIRKLAKGFKLKQLRKIINQYLEDNQ